MRSFRVEGVAFSLAPALLASQFFDKHHGKLSLEDWASFWLAARSGTRPKRLRLLDLRLAA